MPDPSVGPSTSAVQARDAEIIQEPATARDPEWRALLERVKLLREQAQREEPDPTAPLPARRLRILPQAARPLVNDMARSALFAAIQGKDRHLYHEELIATIEGIEIRFSGEQWNQDDHDLLMQLINMAGHAPLGTDVSLSGHAILQALGRTTGGSAHAQLRQDITRLVAGTIILHNPRLRMHFIGNLVTSAGQHKTSGRWLVTLSPNLHRLYGTSTYTLVDWEQRLRLRGKELARWLHLYLATHAVPFPVKVATLKTLSGSRTAALRTFRQKLKLALTDLQTHGIITAWEIDDTDLVHVERGAAATNSQRRHIARQPLQLRTTP